MANPERDVVAHLVEWRSNVRAFAEHNFGFVPDPWQADVMDDWDAGHQRIAMQACKGPGKTGLLAILIWHFLATRPFPKVACTSISGDNLTDCLWAELAKWQQRSPLLMRVFEWTKTRIECRDHRETWWCSARTWSRTANSEEQAKTLAGLHADYMLFVLDETGGMPEAVMVAAEAALASGIECRILQAGNPIQCEGPLWVAAGRDRRLWRIVEITGDPDDPKRSPRIDPNWAREQIASHGRDNPWVMANVLGKFPSASPLAFIGAGLVDEATKREATAIITDAFVMGVDVARFGDDESVIRFRKGRDARTHPPLKFRNVDNMQLAARIAEQAQNFQADGVFIDGGGNGGGVVDRCRQLHVRNVFEVQFGGKPDGITFTDDRTLYANKAGQMYGCLKEWLKTGAIDNDGKLRTDLISRRYAYKLVAGRECLVLEPKDAMKQRGLASPDDADALALTFAYPAQAHARAGFEGAGAMRPMLNAMHDYDPFASSANPQVRSDYDPYR